jgi:nicotinate-nucleotide adenylyltransferase
MHQLYFGGAVVHQHAAAVFYDLPALFAIRDVLASLDLQREPQARLLREPESVQRIRRLGVIAGSFNPLTSAHVALAEAARRELSLEAMLFAISEVAVDKEEATVAALEDRLLLLSLCTRDLLSFGLAVLNRGLYADQAQALDHALPQVRELLFVVGLDKAIQIFDPRYYIDRDQALGRLFGLASLVVAPRGDRGLPDLEDLMKRPENGPYRDRVLPLAMPHQYRHLASSDVRELVRRGVPLAGQLPNEAVAFIEKTGAYRSPGRLPGGEEVDAYGLRLSLLEALHRARPWAERQGAFRSLLDLALEDSASGRALRGFLGQLPVGDLTLDLQAFQAVASAQEAARG